MEAQQSGLLHTDDPSQVIGLTLAEEGFAAEEPTTISRLLQKAVAKFRNHPALRFKENTVWKELTYSQYYDYCVEVAKACIQVTDSQSRFSWQLACYPSN